MAKSHQPIKQNNTMETLYRKVAVTDRMPDKDGNYYTEQGLVTFEKGTFWQYEGRAFVKSNSNITYWLEEIRDTSHQLEKLEADKAELLEALDKINDLVTDFTADSLMIIEDISGRIIQKYKQ